MRRCLPYLPSILSLSLSPIFMRKTATRGRRNEGERERGRFHSILSKSGREKKIETRKEARRRRGDKPDSMRSILRSALLWPSGSLLNILVIIVISSLFSYSHPSLSISRTASIPRPVSFFPPFPSAHSSGPDVCISLSFSLLHPHLILPSPFFLFHSFSFGSFRSHYEGERSFLSRFRLRHFFSFFHSLLVLLSPFLSHGLSACPFNFFPIPFFCWFCCCFFFSRLTVAYIRTMQPFFTLALHLAYFVNNLPVS